MSGPQVLLLLQPDPAAGQGLPIVIAEQPAQITAIFSSLDTVAVALADVGAAAVVGGASTPVAGADTLAVALSDAGLVVAAFVMADGVAVAAFETPALLALLASVDLGSIGVTDDGIVFLTIASADGVSVVLLDLAAVATLTDVTPVAAGDVAALALDDAASVQDVTSGPGPAGLPSYPGLYQGLSAGFRWPGVTMPEPTKLVPISANDALACSLAEPDDPVVVAPDRRYIDSRYWRRVVERDDEEVILLLA